VQTLFRRASYRECRRWPCASLQSEQQISFTARSGKLCQPSGQSLALSDHEVSGQQATADGRAIDA
jgi:hypothetical protein